MVRNSVIVGSKMFDYGLRNNSPPGHVRAYDARSGKLKWVFHTVPQEGEPFVETWENDSWKKAGNTNVWTMMAADEELGYVYLPTSTPTNDYWGGKRHGDNVFAESIVCVDAETGERVWHFQTVHHGVWDYDIGSAPNLVDVVVDGKPVKAIAQVSKTAFTYVFDRQTGEPIWPIEERPVDVGNVPGEKLSPTQPFPTKPPAFDRQGATVDDLIDFTPELRAEAVELVKNYNLGPIFSPLPVKGADGKLGTIMIPGAGGGASFPGASIDPDTGIKHLNLGPLGSMYPSGSVAEGGILVTKTLLISYVAKLDEFGDRRAHGVRLRALDKTTGDVIAAVDVDRSLHGAPMTYFHEGRQYVAVAGGGVVRTNRQLSNDARNYRKGVA